MNSSNNDTNNLLLDFDSQAEVDINLTPEQIDRAAELSEAIIDPQQQWQTYLNGLALFGFTDWLAERDDSLIVDTDNCSLMQPQYANYINGVFDLLVGDFKVCLLTNGVAINELVTFPQAVLEIPEYTAHFYILVNVIEERGEVTIDSFLRYDEIRARIETNSLTPDADWNYELPLAWFNREVDDFLLYLRCLDSQAISLPIATTNSNLDNICGELESLISQLQSSNRSLSEIITWEQGKQVLANPNLLTWLYELQTRNLSVRDAVSSLSNSLSTAINTTVENVTQRVINVKSWLSSELDEMAQNLAWNLLPTPTFATAQFRDIQAINRESLAEEFTAILTQLRDSGEEIPTDAGGAYKDFTLAMYALRLFAVTWEIEETENVREWNLSIFLGAQINSYLPAGLKLELKQDDTVLDERVTDIDTDDTYLFVRVIGELHEQFIVTITLASGESITLPKFVYQ